MLLEIAEDHLSGFLVGLDHALLLDHPVPQIVPAGICDPLLPDDRSRMAGDTLIIGLLRPKTIRQIAKFGIRRAERCCRRLGGGTLRLSCRGYGLLKRGSGQGAATRSSSTLLSGSLVREYLCELPPQRSDCRVSAALRLGGHAMP